MSSAFGGFLSDYYVYNEVMEDGSDHITDPFPAQKKIQNNDFNNGDDSNWSLGLAVIIVIMVIIGLFH